MAPRSAGSRKVRQIENAEEGRDLGDLVARHRFMLAGATAFIVAFSYVAANAIWYQPHAHGGAFFETRPISSDLALAPATDDDGGETVIRLERETADSVSRTDPPPVSEIVPDVDAVLDELGDSDPVPVPAPPSPQERVGDPTIREVQNVLAELKFYDGALDGLTGPRTREAVEAYRKTVGLGDSGEIDQSLLDQLGIAEANEEPPLPQSAPGTDMIETASARPTQSDETGDPIVLRIQAGLKAFGNDGIEIDGVVGSRTRSAILEFQSLFGLPETGEPDSALYAKMREIGLTE